MGQDEELKKFMEEVQDYRTARQYLTIGLIRAAGHEAELGHIPYRKVEDMAMVYRIEKQAGDGSGIRVTVNNRMLEWYRVSEQDLYTDAMKYAPANSPMQIRSMADVICELSGVNIKTDERLYIAGSTRNIDGASVICYPGFFEEAARKVGGSYFIIPSSVHEVILAKDNGCMDAAGLEGIITGINRSLVSREEQLEDHAYHYDAECRMFETAQEYEERKQIDPFYAYHPSAEAGPQQEHRQIGSRHSRKNEEERKEEYGPEM